MNQLFGLQHRGVWNDVLLSSGRWASLMDGRMSRYGNNFISHFFVFC